MILLSAVNCHLTVIALRVGAAEFTQALRQKSRATIMTCEDLGAVRTPTAAAAWRVHRVATSLANTAGHVAR